MTPQQGVDIGKSTFEKKFFQGKNDFIKILISIKMKLRIITKKFAVYSATLSFGIIDFMAYNLHRDHPPASALMDIYILQRQRVYHNNFGEEIFCIKLP